MQKEPEVAAMISESWLRWDDEGVEDDDDLLKGGMFEELGAFLASDSDASSSLLDGLQLPGSVGGGELLVSSSPLVMDLDILDAGVLPPVVGADGQIDDADVSTAAEGTAEMKSSPVPHPQPAAARQPGSSPPTPRRAEHGSAAAASAAAPGSGDCAAAAAQLPGPNAAAVGVPEMMVPAGLGMAVSWPVSPEAMLSVFHQLSPAAESAPYLPLQMLAAGNTALPPACLPPGSSVPDWQSAFRPPLSCQAVLPFLGCTAPVLGSVAPLPSATTTGVPVTEAPAIPEQRNSARVAGWGGAPLARRQSDCSSDLGCSDPEAVAAGSSTRDGDSQSAAEVGLVPVDPRASEQGVAEVPAADATDAAPKPEPAWPGIPIPQSIAPSHGGVLPAPLAPFTAALPVAAMMSHGGRLLSQCRSRQECLKRYKAKRAQRAKTKKIRYHLRKLNADSRPRWKGRFVKKEDVPAVLASQREERRERLEFPDDDALHLSLALPDVDILQMRDATGVLDEALLLLDRTAL